MVLYRNPHVLLLFITLLWPGETPEAASIPEHESVKNKTLTLGLLAAYDFVGFMFVPAIIPGLQMVEEQQLLPGYQIEWSWMETQCQPDTGKSDDQNTRHDMLKEKHYMYYVIIIMSLLKNQKL